MSESYAATRLWNDVIQCAVAVAIVMLPQAAHASETRDALRCHVTR
jgi:hypothetical protein